MSSSSSIFMLMRGVRRPGDPPSRSLHKLNRSLTSETRCMLERVEYAAVRPKRPMKSDHRRSSRQRYLGFVQDYKHRRLDDATEAAKDHKQLGAPADAGDAARASAPESQDLGKRRERLCEYLRWLRPNRYAVGIVL